MEWKKGRRAGRVEDRRLGNVPIAAKLSGLAAPTRDSGVSKVVKDLRNKRVSYDVVLYEHNKIKSK